MVRVFGIAVGNLDVHEHEPRHHALAHRPLPDAQRPGVAEGEQQVGDLRSGGSVGRRMLREERC